MLKKIKGKFAVLLLLLSIVPFLNVSALESRTVNNQDELKQALSDDSVTNIVLGKDIETTEKITIVKNVTIDGNNHTIEYVGTFGDDGSHDNTIWSSIYVLQVYKANVTLKNIKLTGGNAALLANGATVTLKGKIDVSGNGFGGIELSQGKDVTTTAHLILDDDVDLVNTTEDSNSPTLWVPKNNKGENAIIEMNGVEKVITNDEELTITEVEKILGIENPNTSDSFINIAYLIALIPLFYSAKKLISEN